MFHQSLPYKVYTSPVDNWDVLSTHGAIQRDTFTYPTHSLSFSIIFTQINLWLFAKPQLIYILFWKFSNFRISEFSYDKRDLNFVENHYSKMSQPVTKQENAVSVQGIPPMNSIAGDSQWPLPVPVLRQLKRIKGTVPQEIYKKLVVLALKRHEKKLSPEQYDSGCFELIKPYQELIMADLKSDCQTFFRSSNPDLRKRLLGENPFLKPLMEKIVKQKKMNLTGPVRIFLYPRFE